MKILYFLVVIMFLGMLFQGTGLGNFFDYLFGAIMLTGFIVFSLVTLSASEKLRDKFSFLKAIANWLDKSDEEEKKNDIKPIDSDTEYAFTEIKALAKVYVSSTVAMFWFGLFGLTVFCSGKRIPMFDYYCYQIFHKESMEVIAIVWTFSVIFMCAQNIEYKFRMRTRNFE